MAAVQSAMDVHRVVDRVEKICSDWDTSYWEGSGSIKSNLPYTGLYIIHCYLEQEVPHTDSLWQPAATPWGAGS